MTRNQDPTTPSTPATVGSVGEEAAKLLGALSGWARDQGADLGQRPRRSRDQAASLPEVNDHLATGSAE